MKGTSRRNIKMPVTISILNDDKYQPHPYLNKAIDEMKDYCLPYGQVKIANPETGAIVALILYMIAKDKTVGRTKLECYTILLNRMIKADTGKKLFTLSLNKRGRINSFKKIFDYMLEHELILSNGRSQFYVLSGAKKIISRLPVMLDRLLSYLDKLLDDYKSCTAAETLRKTIKPEVILYNGIEYLTLFKASEKLGISYMILLLMCREGKIDGAIRGNNGLWLVPCSSLKNIHPKVIMRATSIGSIAEPHYNENGCHSQSQE